MTPVRRSRRPHSKKAAGTNTESASHLAVQRRSSPVLSAALWSIRRAVYFSLFPPSSVPVQR